MTVRLKFGHLADYAAAGANGKLILVGIYDIVWAHVKEPSIPIPLSYLAVSVEASVADGSEHQVELRFVDEDGDSVLKTVDFGNLIFQASGPGRPLAVQLISMLGGLSVPKVGEYAFEVWVDGRRVGEVPLYVAEPVAS